MPIGRSGRVLFTTRGRLQQLLQFKIPIAVGAGVSFCCLRGGGDVSARERGHWDRQPLQQGFAGGSWGDRCTRGDWGCVVAYGRTANARGGRSGSRIQQVRFGVGAGGWRWPVRRRSQMVPRARSRAGSGADGRRRRGRHIHSLRKDVVIVIISTSVKGSIKPGLRRYHVVGSVGAGGRGLVVDLREPTENTARI
jgi:hypothetical protein